MSAPTGTVYPTGLDTGSATIGTSVSSGQVIASAYADTSSSAILAIEGALGTNPQGSDSTVGVALTNRARKTDVQNQTLTYAADSGSANTYVVALSPALTAYAAGTVVVFKAANANTGASTLNVNSLGAKSLVKNGNVALASGDINAGEIYTAIFDGTNFQMAGSIALPVSVANGGTGASTASAARTNLTAAASGANADITSIASPATGLTINGDYTLLHGATGIYVDTVNNEIGVANYQGNAITIYSRTANGNVVPLRTISGSSTSLGYPTGIYVDTTNNEIGVTCFYSNTVLIFSRTANGNVSPLRSLTGSSTTLNNPYGIYVDTTNNEIGVANSGNNTITVFSRTASGNTAPLRTLSGASTTLNAPYGIYVDTTNNEIGATNLSSTAVTVFSRTASGNTAPLRTLSGSSTLLNNPSGIYLDTTNNEIGVANYYANLITVYSRTASGNTAPLRSISGSATLLNYPFALYVDTTNNEIGTVNGVGNTVNVFSRTASGNVAPLREIDSAAVNPLTVNFNGNSVFLVAASSYTTPQVNGVTVTTGATGTAPIIQSGGSAADANLGLTLSSLGSGNLTLSGGTSGAVIVNTSSPSGRLFSAQVSSTEHLGVTTDGSLVVSSPTLTTNDPGVSISQTWNASGTTFQGLNVNITNTASAAASNVIQTQLAGTTKFSVGLNGSLQTSGVKVSVNAQSAAYTATSDDYAIVVTTGSTTRAITLTASSSNKGQLLYIQKADSGAGAVTVTAAGSDKINGATTYSLASQYNSITLVADGAGNWLKIAST